jgi:AmiR/NasT family two-component response regulator
MADSAKRVQKHRDKMKAAGLKPVTIWVPDVNAPSFKEQIARDIAIINADADSHLVMEQMLSVADFSDWV